MRKFRKLFSKWYVQLFLVLLTTIMGAIGYYIYYQSQESPMIPAALRIQTFFSTLRLFTLSFDVDNKVFTAGNYPAGQKEWVLQMLQTARFLGLLLTGTTLFKVLSNHIAYLSEQIQFFKWNFKTNKLLLIGSNDDNCLLYRSADKEYAGMIICTSSDDSANLTDKGYSSIHSEDLNGLLSELISKTIRDVNKKATIIINTKQEEENLELSRTAINVINTYLQDDNQTIADLRKAADDLNRITKQIKDETDNGTKYAEDPEKARTASDQYSKWIKNAKEQIKKAGNSLEISNYLKEIEENLSKKADLNTEEEEDAVRKKIIDLCTSADRSILKACLPLQEKITDILQRIRIVVFGSRDYRSIYRDIQHESFYPVKCLNKYSLTAFDFVSNYPLTKFIPEHERHDEILTKTGSITKEAEFNMILIGFGDTNQEIFLTSFSSNQFMQHGEDGDPEPKPVSYYIFDKDPNLNEKNLNHDIFRYKEEFLKLIGTDDPGAPKESDFLPICPYPACIKMYPEDIDNSYFYNHIRQICQKNPLSINYIVIAINDDMDNVDLAQRLSEKKKEWGLKNIHIFTKIRDPKNEENIRFFSKRDFIPFGSEAFPLEALLVNEVESMAFRKSTEHTKYLLMKKYPFLSEQECRSYCNYEWLTMDPTMHMSNIFNFIGLRLKLNLLGFDYEKQPDDGKPAQNRVSLQDYADRYSKGDPALKLSEEAGLIYSNTKIDRREDIKKDIPRKNLAVQEHYRWNAFMIMNGFIPGTIEQIRQGKHKSYSMRYHANITTLEGLFKFRELRAQFTHRTEVDTDVIRYDYRPMDGAWAYLNQIGYDVVRVSNEEKSADKEQPQGK